MARRAAPALVLLAVTLCCSPPSVAAPCANGLYLRLQAARDLRLPPAVAGSGVRDAFVYGPGIGHDPAGEAAAADRIRSTLPGVRVIAVVGRRVCGMGSAGHCLALQDEPSRRRLSLQAAGLWKRGYDGIQFDLEPVASGDPNLVELLRTTRLTKPVGKILSLAGYSLEPTDGSGAQSPQRPRAGGPVVHWSAGYYRELMAQVDQVMVMNYDTAIWTAGAFQRFTSWQARHFLAIRPPGLALQFGLPSDVSGRTNYFDRRAENLAVGSDALRDTFGGAAGCPTDVGVTIFTAEGMTTASWDRFAHRFGSPTRTEAPDPVGKH